MVSEMHQSWAQLIILLSLPPANPANQPEVQHAGGCVDPWFQKISLFTLYLQQYNSYK